MMRQQYDGHRNPTDPIPRVEDRNNYQNFCQSDSHKTINQDEDFLEGEAEDSPTAEEDTPGEEDVNSNKSSVSGSGRTRFHYTNLTNPQ